MNIRWNPEIALPDMTQNLMPHLHILPSLSPTFLKDLDADWKEWAATQRALLTRPRAMWPAFRQITESAKALPLTWGLWREGRNRNKTVFRFKTGRQSTATAWRVSLNFFLSQKWCNSFIEEVTEVVFSQFYADDTISKLNMKHPYLMYFLYDGPTHRAVKQQVFCSRKAWHQYGK